MIWQIPYPLLTYFDASELPVLMNGQDKKVWTYDMTGKFSVAGATQMIRKKYPILTWAKRVWNPCVQPYTSSNLWKILRGACATDESVRKKGFSTVSKCYLCGNNQDTMDHILWSCTFSEQIWHWLSGIFHCTSPKCFEDVIEVAKGKSSAIKQVWYNSAFNTMVELWFTRNSVIYEAVTPDVEKFKQRIIRVTGECSARMKGEMWGTMYDLQVLLFFGISGVRAKITTVKQCFFKMLELNQILISCNGAYKGNPGMAGLGFVARNSSGACIGVASGGLGLATNY
ncbi:uncharacterized protein LOC113279590 [Papaver somniferum]|uniref:uncharacterized protein LOC113279590 n=1 Tax=Papaver somniferum TaxID=3469 RepID=UPI000E7022F1|nr:uncharacterized protein LOC113279590 [Papaver somniferum]